MHLQNIFTNGKSLLLIEMEIKLFFSKTENSFVLLITK